MAHRWRPVPTPAAPWGQAGRPGPAADPLPPRPGAAVLRSIPAARRDVMQRSPGAERPGAAGWVCRVAPVPGHYPPLGAAGGTGRGRRAPSIGLLDGTHIGSRHRPDPTRSALQPRARPDLWAAVVAERLGHPPGHRPDARPVRPGAQRPRQDRCAWRALGSPLSSAIARPSRAPTYGKAVTNFGSLLDLSTAHAISVTHGTAIRRREAQRALRQILRTGVAPRQSILASGSVQPRPRNHRSHRFRRLLRSQLP